jgi:hypothetical protein
MRSKRSRLPISIPVISILICTPVLASSAQLLRHKLDRAQMAKVQLTKSFVF